MNDSTPVFSVRGYGRASTDAQVASTEVQHARVQDGFDAYRRIKSSWANATWGGWFADEATSRVSVFRERHAGSLLLAACKPGDVILVSMYDRIFASVVDVCETMELLKAMKVGLIIMDSDFDTTSPVGEFCFKVLALVKELEVRHIRERTKAALEHRRRLGKPTGVRPIGWKIVNVSIEGVARPQKFYVPDHKARRLANEILSIKESNGLTYTAACEVCNKAGRKQLNKRRWTHPTFIGWCRAAEKGFPLPNGQHEAAPIPPDAKPVNINTISEEDD